MRADGGYAPHVPMSFLPLWLLAPFVVTRPHPAPEGTFEVAFSRREAMTVDGVWCAWEAESLRYAGEPIWAADAPEDEHWCTTPGESARMVDVLGQDGPYLSVRLTEWSCCPDREVVTPCVTYDLRTRAPATLEAYDPDHWPFREKRLAQLLGKKYGPGWSVDPTAFVVGGGHVKVCATRGDERIEIPIR